MFTDVNHRIIVQVLFVVKRADSHAFMRPYRSSHSSGQPDSQHVIFSGDRGDGGGGVGGRVGGGVGGRGVGRRVGDGGEGGTQGRVRGRIGRGHRQVD